jgi:hypothetical protein
VKRNGPRSLTSRFSQVGMKLRGALWTDFTSDNDASRQ